MFAAVGIIKEYDERVDKSGEMNESLRNTPDSHRGLTESKHLMCAPAGKAVKHHQFVLICVTSREEGLLHRRGHV